jgi:enoyl-CoA hydratase
VGYVSIAERAGVAVLAVDRPPANAMDVGLLGELVEAIDGLAAEVPSALVLAGREGFYSAGADLKAVPGYGPAEQRAMVEGINRMALGVYGLPCPVVCAITGHAIAGGMVLALCGDHRVASTEGRYGLTEVKVGVPYPQAAIGVVRAELAAPAARLLALGNRLVDAAECVRLGAFDEAVAPGAVLDRALAVARELAAMPAEVYARTKAELRGATLATLRINAERDPLLDAWIGAP